MKVKAENLKIAQVIHHQGTRFFIAKKRTVFYKNGRKKTDLEGYAPFADKAEIIVPMKMTLKADTLITIIDHEDRS